MSFLRINDAVEIYTPPAIGRTDNKADTKEDLVMALTIEKPKNEFRVADILSVLSAESAEGTQLPPLRGLVRVITKRQGNANIPGYIDESELWHVESPDGLRWQKTSKLLIHGMDKIIDDLTFDCQGDFLGLEDPDIWIDDNGTKHVYFTIAIKPHDGGNIQVYLGHAEGESLDTLWATKPVLSPMNGINNGFKEIVVSPVTSAIDGHRFKLTESNDAHYSVISSIKVKNPSNSARVDSIDTAHADWEFSSIAAHPKTIGHAWCSEHASPCTIFSPDFLKHENLLVGIMNGRESSIIEEDGRALYRKFRPGLFLFNPDTGEIPWVSPEPLFEDPEAETITFASDFIQTGANEGMLYAHVNDAFVRAYRINKEGILNLLKSSYPAMA